MRFPGVVGVCLVLAGCVGGSGSGGAVVETSPDGKALIETQIGPNGEKVMEFTIRSGATGTLPAGMLPPEAAAEYARIAAQVKPGDIGYYRYVGPKGTAAPVTQQLPDFAGVPQSMTTKTDGTRTTKTYTYGTPPAERKSKKVASEPKAQASYGGVPACSLTMVGGTGYACASD